MVKNINKIVISALVIISIICLLLMPFHYSSLDVIAYAETTSSNTIISFYSTRYQIAGIRLYLQKSYLLQNRDNNLIVEAWNDTEKISSSTIPLNDLPVQGFQDIVFKQAIQLSDNEPPIKFVIYPQFQLNDSELLYISLRDEQVSNIDETPRIIYQDSGLHLAREMRDKIIQDNKFAHYYATIFLILVICICILGVINIFPKKRLNNFCRKSRH